MPRTQTNEEAAHIHLIARLSAITTANGYRTDAGAKIIDGWLHTTTQAEASDPTIKIAVSEQPQSGVYQDSGNGSFASTRIPETYHWAMRYLIEVFIRVAATSNRVADLDAARADVFDVRADLKKALLIYDRATDGEIDVVINSVETHDLDAGGKTIVVAYDVDLLVGECRGISTSGDYS